MKRLLCALFGLMFTIPAMSATLPSGYTELEYIQSDGTNWIETNYRGTEKTGAYLRYQYHSLSKDLSGRVFGYRISTDHQWVTYIGTNSGTTIDTTIYYVQSGALETTPEGLPTLDTEIHEFRINTDGSGEVLFDGALFGNSNGATAFTASQTLRIFSAYNNSQYSNATARIYAVSIYENGVLQKNFVPAKHGNDVGMYETVMGTFYQKSGEHDFVAGPEICPNGGTPQTYTSATGTGTQSPDPTPEHPVTPVFYQQGDMILRAVGSYADSYDPATGKITRRVGVITLNGSENWFYTKPNGEPYLGFMYNLEINDMFAELSTVTTNRQSPYSTHFARSTDWISGQTNRLNKVQSWLPKNDGTPILGLGYSDVSDANLPAFKTWLSSHPVTIWYPLAEANWYTEDWAATQCESGNTCNNLFVADNTTPGYYIDATGAPKSDNYSNYYEYPVTPGQTYTWSGVCGDNSTYNNKRVHGYANGVWQQQITMQAINPDEHYSITFEVPQGITSIRLSFWNDDTMVKLEQGSTATTYCRAPGKIKIATTKYNNAAFSGVVTALSNAVDTIKTVVSNTINQATAVANLQSGKQTKPTDTCPNGKICLLVEDDNGTPHWYEIIERAPGIVPAGSGYTQVEYLQSDGNQWINTGYAKYATGNIYRLASKVSWADVQTRQLQGCQDMFYYGVNSGYFQVAQAGVVLTTTAAQANTVYEIDATFNAVNNTATYSVNGIQYTVPQVGGTAQTMGYITAHDGENFGVFSLNNNTLPFGTAKVYYYKLYHNGALVFDGVPARRNSDGVLGMYDTVSGNFFTNQGSGKFYAPDQYVPSAYTRLEYIESTGTQYIDTGVVGTINTDIEIKGADFTAASAQLVVTTTMAAGGSMLRIAKFTATQKVGAGIGTSAPTYSNSDGVNQFVAKLQNHNFYLDGQLVGAVSTDGFNQQNMGNVLIFSGVYGSNRYYGVGKVYYVKMWDNGTPVREMVPVRRNSDNELGMYDCVNGVFYDNDGTGDFLAPGQSGSSLPAGYTQLQYIQSDGGAYIDTGLYGNLNTEAEIDVQLNETTNSSGNRIFGDYTNVDKAITINSANSADAKSRFGNIYQTLNIYSSERSVYKINKTNLTRNGVVLMTFDTTTPFTTEGTLLVGSSTSAGGGVVGKLYSAIIRENGNVVMHLVPVQYGTSIGMYDLANNQFLRKGGTGEFTAGPAVQ